MSSDISDEEEEISALAPLLTLEIGGSPEYGEDYNQLVTINSALGFTETLVSVIVVGVREVDNNEEIRNVNKIFGQIHKPKFSSGTLRERSLELKVTLKKPKTYRIFARVKEKHIKGSPIVIQPKILQSNSASEQACDRLDKNKNLMTESHLLPSKAKHIENTQDGHCCTFRSTRELSHRSNSGLDSTFVSSGPELDQKQPSSSPDFIPSAVRKMLASKLENQMRKMRLSDEVLTKGTSQASTVPQKDVGVNRMEPTTPFNFCDVKTWKQHWNILNTANRNRDKGCPSGVVDRPIGMCILSNGTVVVSSTFEDKVKMFQSSDGKFVKEVLSQIGKFDHPSDMVTLPDSGGFAVRDRTRVMLFTMEGVYKETVQEGRYCYGLAIDEKKRLVCLESSKKTCKLKFLDYSGCDIKQTRVVDLRGALSDKQAESKCRFLTYHNGAGVVVDLGLDKIYVLENVNGKFTPWVFGDSGSGPGQFNDPAGVVCDELGNMIIADSKNHRLCLYDSTRKFVKVVATLPSVKRPSGLTFSPTTGELFVLGFGRNGVVKFRPG